MYTVMIQEYETSERQFFEMPMDAAYRLTSKGAFYKAQIIGEFGEVIYEF